MLILGGSQGHYTTFVQAPVVSDLLTLVSSYYMRNFLIYYYLFVFRADPMRSNNYIVRLRVYPEWSVFYIRKEFSDITKNVPWHILAPAAVACDTYLVRRSAHP